MAGMKLEVWKGDWNLPSCDPECLAVMTYCKFAQVPIDFHKTSNPWRSPSGFLPVFRHNGTTITDVPKIFDYLRQQNWGTDFDLSSKQSAEILAFNSLLEKKMLPALRNLLWMNEQVYSDVTRPFYGKAMGFPQSFYVPDRMKNKIRDFLTACVPNINDVTAEQRDTQVNKDAKECLNYLSNRLGKNDFFFGKIPSSLDAIVFGYLAPLFKAPLPNNPLTGHLKACDNLCQLCTRILMRYFPPTQEEIEEERRKEEEERKRAQTSDEFPNKKRNIFLAVLTGLSAMVAYVFLSGIVTIEVMDDEPETVAVAD